MEIEPTPPPYDDTSADTRNEKPAEVAPERTERAAGASTEQPTVEDEQPHIVLYVYIHRNKRSGKLGAFKSSRGAVMLSPSSTYKDTRAFLEKRLVNHEKSLQIPAEAEIKLVLYYSVQDGAKDPWLDSNWHNNICIFDEESWKACRALMAKNEKAILMMLVYRTDDLDAGSDKKEETDEGSVKTKTTKKSCIIQ